MRWSLVVLACTAAVGCAELLAVDELAAVDAKPDEALGGGGGEASACVDDSSCPTPAGPCFESVCELGSCVVMGLEVGTACGPSSSCSAEGECLAARGAQCGENNECATGYCSDGVCCNKACSECARCDVPGSEGTCQLLAPGAPDDQGACGDSTCDGLGHCALGEPQGVVLTQLAPKMARIWSAARRSDGSWFFGGSHVSAKLEKFGGESDVLLGTLSSAGELINATSFGSEENEGIRRLVLGPDGGGYAVGTCGLATVIPTAQPTTSCSGAQRNSLLIKVDPAGAIEWANVIDDSAADDVAEDVVLVPGDDGVLVAGYGAPDGVASTVRRAKISKYTSSGQFLWDKVFLSSTSFAGLHSVALMPDGDVVAAGTFSGTLTVLTEAVPSVSGSVDVFVVRFDPTVQTVRWLKTIGGGYGDGVGDLAVAPDGSVALAGWFSYSTTVAPNVIVYGDAADAFALVLDGKDGAYRSVVPIAGTADVYASAVEFDVASNLYVGGYFYTAPNATPGTLGLLGKTFVNAGLHDAFLAKVSPQGKPLWARAFGGPGYDVLLSLQVDGSSVVASGSTAGGFDFGQTSVATADGTEDGALFLFGP